jgi:hypothetical protein
VRKLKIRRGYIIRCYTNTSLGFIKQTLGLDSVWYTATNQAAEFKTLAECRKFFKNSNYELRGSNIWIEGPRGGFHYTAEIIR